MKLRKILGNTALSALLASCSSLPGISSADAGPGLWLVPVNHTDRYAPSVFVEDAWAGNVGPQGGGGGAVCCIAGRKDWSKPVLVKWRWGAEEDPVTKAITLEGEDHSAMVHFPRAPKRLNKSIKEPWSTEDYMADEAYLCVILRSFDKVEFAYSYNRGGCKQK
jgi:hypothetical protein